MLATIAIVLPVLLGIVGFTIDLGRMYAAKARLQTAVDAAALAGSRELFNDPDLGNGRVTGAVKEYLQRNYPKARLTDLSLGDEIRGVCVTARAEMRMTFMALMGITSRNVGATSCAGFNDLEIVLVIDNTGSMEGEPIAQVKKAANRLVDLMIPNAEAPGVKIGMVPFRGKVHLGDAADGLPSGCRNADGSENKKFAPSCFEAIPPILALTQEKGQIRDAINLLQAPYENWASSGTIIAEGIKWGREVLSPAFPYQQGGDSSKYRKVMILVSDGDNQDGTCGSGCNPRASSDCTYRRNAYFGMGVRNCGCADYGCLDQAMLEEAAEAKQEGVEIFVVRYGASAPVDIELLKEMASSTSGTDDHYFDAATTNDIEKMFKQIGRRLGFRIVS